MSFFPIESHDKKGMAPITRVMNEAPIDDPPSGAPPSDSSGAVSLSLLARLKVYLVGDNYRYQSSLLM